MFRERGPAQSEEISGSFMEDVRVVNRKSGAHQWTLNALEVLIPTGGEPSRLSDVSVELPEQGMRVVSDSGLYDFQTRNLVLLGNIRARTDDYIIKMDSIYVESEKGELSSPDKVIIESETFRIEGQGFVANSNRKVVFNKNVKATIF